MITWIEFLFLVFFDTYIVHHDIWFGNKWNLMTLVLKIDLNLFLFYSCLFFYCLFCEYDIYICFCCCCCVIVFCFFVVVGNWWWKREGYHWNALNFTDVSLYFVDCCLVIVVEIRLDWIIKMSKVVVTVYFFIFLFIFFCVLFYFDWMQCY